MTQEPLHRARRVPRFLSFPIRRSLEGVSWASLSVQWRPTEDQKQQRREEIERFWLRSDRLDMRPPLHPVGSRRFPFERLYSRLGRTDRPPWPTDRFAPRSRSGWKSPSVS